MKDTPFCLFTIPKNKKKIIWEITSFCNMDCKHCCSNSSSGINLNEFIFLNRKIIKQRVDEMISFGIKEFYISGGEPFLVKNIFDFLKYLKEKNVRVKVATNGYCLNKSIIQQLSKIKIDLLHLSLDGHLSKIHNYLRGGRFFNQIIKNIRILIEYKVPLRIGCIIWRRNENYLEKMVKLCIKLGIRELRFSWLIKVGRFKNNLQLYPKTKFPSVINKIDGLRKKYKNKIEITIHRDSKAKYSKTFQICPGGEKLFFLTPEGKLSPCSWITKIDYDFLTKKSIQEKTFRRLINAKEIKKFRIMVKTRKNKNLKGCPFIAKYQNHSYDFNDNLIGL